MAVIGLEEGSSPALLISEVQNNIANLVYNDTPLIRQVDERGIVPKINALAEGFRKAGRPVVHCTISARKGFVGWNDNCRLAHRLLKERRLEEGTLAAAIHDDIVVADTDIISARHHAMTPFTGSSLDAMLRGFGVDTVVFAGVSTNIALPGGCSEAVGLAYKVVLAEDCTAGGTAESHDFQIRMHLPLLATISDSAAILDTPALKV
jgi:nicotinamidase-related amidase